MVEFQIVFTDKYETQKLELHDAVRMAKGGNVESITALIAEGMDCRVDLAKGEIWSGGQLLVVDKTPGERRFLLYMPRFKQLQVNGQGTPKILSFYVVGYQKTIDGKNVKTIAFIDPYQPAIEIREDDLFFDGPEGNGRLSAYYDLVGAEEDG